VGDRGDKLCACAGPATRFPPRWGQEPSRCRVRGGVCGWMV